MELLIVMSGGDVKKYGKICSITGFFRGIMVYNDKIIFVIFLGGGVDIFYKNILNMCESCHYQVP